MFYNKALKTLPMKVSYYIKRSLVELGLTESEAAVYFVLLQLNSAVAEEIRSKMGLSTAGIYKILDSLKDKEFVVARKINGISGFFPVPLDRIALQFAKRGRRLARTSDKFKELGKLKKLNDFNPDSEISGGNALTDFYLNLPYKIDDFIFCIGSFEAVINFFGPEIEKEFIKTRVKKGRPASAIIFDSSQYTRDLVGRNIAEKRETKVIPQSGYPLEFSYIFADRMMTFFRDSKGELKVYSIASPEVAKSQMMHFQALWKNNLT